METESQPDPNLDDEALMEAMFECQEAIARGDACVMCEAVWRHHRMTHQPGCLYVRVSDLMEEHDNIEYYLDQADQAWADS
jgi:hypothetical protein